MFIVTNRNLQPKKPAVERFGPDLNTKGPNELRLAEAHHVHGKWDVQILDDSLSLHGEKVDASEYAFANLQKTMKTKKKNALFFVHGFNNNFESVLERALGFQKNYGVEPVIFTWPANGGGAKGAIKYKSDKRDAAASIGAFDRCLEKMSAYFDDYADDKCHQKVSLLLHSMGNYLFKNLLKSSIYNGEICLFDNIIMAAADVNNYNHRNWVERLQFRRRLYITINENDIALRMSRLKFGEKQHARLGHFTQNLTAQNARYVDFSSGKNVGSDHAYFEGKPLKNKRIKKFFHKAINGERAEEGLPYDIDSGTFQVK